MHSNITNQIVQLLGGKELRPFEPIAFYNAHMDCIRVELRDCSFTEERLNEQVTLLEDNFPSSHQGRIAGLKIKGVKHFFSAMGWPMEGIVYVTSIMNQLVKQNPTLAELHICRLVSELDLTVNMSEPEELLAA